MAKTGTATTHRRAATMAVALLTVGLGTWQAPPAAAEATPYLPRRP